MDPYQKAFEDRDWAPDGGTSYNTAQQAQQRLHGLVCTAIADRLSNYTCLYGADLDKPISVRLPTLYWFENSSRHDFYAFTAHLEHHLFSPPQDMTTVVRVIYKANEFSRGVKLVDVQLTGETARDQHLIADMILGAVERHGLSLGVGAAAGTVRRGEAAPQTEVEQ